MTDGEMQAQSSQMTLGKGVGIYTALLVALLVSIKLAVSFSWFPGAIVFIGYLVFGFVLNRVVLRGLIEWHPVYNTIENVSSGKLQAMLFWPISYPGLFFRLGVIKHL